MEGQVPNRMELLLAFDGTQAGVKGLSDSGILELPKIFVRPQEELSEDRAHKKSQIQIPLIDLDGFQEANRRSHIVEEVRMASETWGFFQVVNHGIPQRVFDGMIDGVLGFHEQAAEIKKEYYSRDPTKSIRFTSSYDLFTSRTASWRDTLTLSFSGSDDDIRPDKLPPPCRDSALEYSKHMGILGNTLIGLLSEALGLKTNHLKNMECTKGHRLHCHYYPACPEPDLAIGTTKHSDAGFLTILMQNQISGLQVLYEGQWVDVQPTPGGLVINIGDLLQLVSNGKFKSIVHRAIANRAGPRISVACFFSGPMNADKKYAPVKELISEENPATYKEVVFGEYMNKFVTTAMDSCRVLDYYKL